MTPIWPLNDTTAIVERLAWKAVPHEDQCMSVEDQLKPVLDAELSKVSAASQAASKLVGGLSDVTKLAVLRHPYVAGLLRKGVVLPNDELLYHIASAVIASSRNGSSPPNTLRRHEHLNAKATSVGNLAEMVWDYGSNFPIPELDANGSWTATLDTAAALEVQSKLAEALRNLRSVSRSALSFIDSYIWWLAVRENATRRRAYSSYTFERLPGLVLVCNPHIPKVTAYDVEETLLHEAIHCFLYWLETPSAGLLKRDAPLVHHLVSPWTGTALDPHTAVHAVLVWHGLGAYFKVAMDAKVSSEHSRHFRDRYDFIVQGFRSPNFDRFYSELITFCSMHSQAILAAVRALH